MTEPEIKVCIKVSITGEDGGGERLRLFEAPAGTDVAGILADIATVIPPAFKTIEWETTYLTDPNLTRRSASSSSRTAR